MKVQIPFISVCLSLIAGAALARPMLIHESQRIEPPASNYSFFAYSLGVDGDWAVVSAGRQTPSLGFPEDDYALLYRHDGTQWLYDRMLLSERSETSADWTGLQIAMANGLVALEFNPLYVYRRNGSTFTQIAHPFTAAPYTANWVSGEVHWSGNTLLAARQFCGGQTTDWGAMSATLNADNTWTTPQRLSSGDTGCYEQPISYDISGNTATIAPWTNDFELVPENVHVFTHSAAGWTQSWSIPNGHGVAAVRGNEVIVSARGPKGTLVYRNDGSGEVVDSLRSVQASDRESGITGQIRHTDDVILQYNGDNDRWSVINVFRKNAAGRYEHVAILQPARDDSLSGDMAVSGRRVLAAGSRDRTSQNPVVFAFELPATYVSTPNEQFTFESGSAAAWTPAQGQFAVVTSGGNRVYRQSSLTGDARSVLSGIDWTDQSIEADIRPTAFSGPSRWAGLAVRHVDAANQYYVTLRSSGSIELRKIVNGAVTVLAQAPLIVTAGSRHHVALKALGAQLQVYLNGEPLLWAYDSEIAHGTPALVGYKTQVDYDNVMVNQIGQSTIYNAFRSCAYPNLANDIYWTRSGTGAWGCPSTGVLTQTSTAGSALALIGTPTKDQVVRARTRATAFAAPTGASQERWFGLVARYRNSANYYYVTVRNSNSISLRKVVNGAITVLGTAPLTVTPGTWYNLRLDAVGNSLRAFVNGVQVVQATDSTHPVGQGGAVTFKAAAEYQNFLSWQP